jgi:hypothetical protein
MSKIKEQPTHVLSDLEVYEVSLVGQPAIRRKYLLTKSDEGVGQPLILEKPEDALNTNNEVNPMDKLFDLLQKTEEENFADLLKDAEISKEDATSLLKGAFRVANELELDLTEAGIELPVVEKEVEVVKEVEVIKEVVKEVPVAKEEDGLLSSLSDEQKEQVQALMKAKDDEAKEAIAKADAAEAKALEAENLRKEQEFVAIAKEEYPSLPGTPEELGAVLKAIDENLPEQKDQITALLKAAEEAVIASKQFEEIGAGGNAGNDESAWKQIEAIAKEILEKGEVATMPEAISKAAERNPKLYVEYLKEAR